MIHVPKREVMSVRREGQRVKLLKEGRLVADMPWDAALALAKAIHGTAKLAEEWAKANEVALDHAVLVRAGVPIGLANHPEVRAEGEKQAVNNRDLRRYLRYLPGGVRSTSSVGRPVVVRREAK
jgi:hypothetical protein